MDERPQLCSTSPLECNHVGLRDQNSASQCPMESVVVVSFGVDDVCSICLSERENEVRLSCGHLFCAECILAYFDHNGSYAVQTCPLDRLPVAAVEATTCHVSSPLSARISKYNDSGFSDTYFRKFIRFLLTSFDINSFLLVAALLMNCVFVSLQFGWIDVSAAAVEVLQFLDRVFIVVVFLRIVFLCFSDRIMQVIPRFLST
eukprot:ANDGO_00174.mRNA.1 hypothetical protein